MNTGWLATAFGAGGERTLVYSSSLAGKRYSTQWTVFRGRDRGGLNEIELLLELDPAAMGLGGSVVRQRSYLHCREDLTPVHYLAEVAGGPRWAIHFQQGEVAIEMPDGSRQTLEANGARYAASGHLPGLMALTLAACTDLAAGAGTRLFLVDELVTVPYSTSAAADLPGEGGARWLRSSHQTEFCLNRSGLLIEQRAPGRGVVTRLEAPGPPAPGWPRDLVSLAPAPLAYRPPEDARIRLEDVTIPGPVTPIGATLSIPAGTGPFAAAALFVSGSGAHDRHGIAGEVDTGTHEIMDYLAGSGILGLRFDTRGAGTTSLGTDALDRGLGSDIADAQACLHYLRRHPGAECVPLFLIGHSQGATVALALAALEEAIGGVVLLAPMARNIDEVVADQLSVHGAAAGLTAAQVETQIEDVRAAVQLVKAGRPWAPGQVPDHLLAMFRGPTWLADFLRYRPLELIGRVRCPVLVGQGGRDFQVSPEKDAGRLVAAAHAVGLDCAYELFPELDHLFKPAAGQESTVKQYFDRSRRVAPALLERVANWIIRCAA